MNHLVLLPEEQQPDGTYLVNGARAGYIKEFHRFECGKSYSVALLGVGVGSVVLLDSDDDHYRFAVTVTEEEAAHRPIELICALSRPQTMKKVLQYGAMLRLRRITFVPSSLGEKSYRSSKVLQSENLRYELIKGLEQIGSAFPPEVEIAERFSSAIDVLSAQDDSAVRILAEPKADRLLVDALESGASSFLLAIGCESGWSDEEREAFIGAGFIESKLTDDHLRVEVALVAMVSQLLTRI